MNTWAEAEMFIRWGFAVRRASWPLGEYLSLDTVARAGETVEPYAITSEDLNATDWVMA